MSTESEQSLGDAKAEVGQTATDNLVESKSEDRYHLKLCLRLAVVAVVIFWIEKTFREAGDEFSAAQFSVVNLDLLCVMLAALSYMIGLLCFGLFWHLTLLALGQRPTLVESLRSYTVSQLGKYVPGKALVVIIRSERVSSSRVSGSAAVVGVFIETLGMMAVGGILASSLLLIGYGRTHQSGWLTLLAVGLAVGAGVGASPPVFRFVLRYLSKRRELSMLGEAIDGLSWRFLTKGWLLAAVGWLFFGTSMIFVLQAFPSPENSPILAIWDYPQVVAAVSLSIVAGFISLMPGGAGVREMVISTLLAPLIGPVLAVISAISLRGLWLLCELGVAAAFLIHNGRTNRSAQNKP